MIKRLNMRRKIPIFSLKARPGMDYSQLTAIPEVRKVVCSYRDVARCVAVVVRCVVVVARCVVVVARCVALDGRSNTHIDWGYLSQCPRGGGE